MNFLLMSKMTRFLGGAVIGVVLLFGGTALPARAASLTTAQINAIISLLQAFDADQATIANVQAALGGSTYRVPQGGCHTFNSDLKFGDKGEEVFNLQEILRSEGLEVGNEQSDAIAHSSFRETTASAVVHFQARHGILQTGYVGPLTRVKLNSLYGCNSTTTHLEVRYVSGVATTYTAGQLIVLSIKGVEMPGGYPGTPENGYNMQVYIRDINNRSSYTAWTNATYNSRTGYWDAQLTVPTDSSKAYTVDSSFYCSNSSRYCGTKFDRLSDMGQVTTSFTFKLATPTLSVTSPNGGEQFELGSQIPFYWSQNYSSVDLRVRLWEANSGKEYYYGHISGGMGKNKDVLQGEAVNVPTGSYKITICDEGTPNPAVTFKSLCDTSDLPFLVAVTVP